MLKRLLSVLLALCMIVSVFSIGITAKTVEIAPTGNFLAEKAMEKAYDICMRAVSCGMDAVADATGKSGKTGWETAISFVNDWVFKDASEVVAEEVKELCIEILNELYQIENQINNSMSIVDSMVSKSIVETAKQAVNTQWDNDVTGPINTYRAKGAFDSYQQYVKDAVEGVKSKAQMQADLDELIDDFYLMYSGNEELGSDKKETMFTHSQLNGTFETMIKALADNLDKSGSVTEKSAYFAYMAYPFSHQQYTYVYNMMEKQLVYMILVEMMYNEYLFQQGEYLANTEGYGIGSAAYDEYERYQQSFYDLMMTNASSVNEHIGNMLDTKITVDTASGVTLGLEDYMKPEDAVSVPLTFPYVYDPVDDVLKPTYRKSYDFWDEAVDMANAYDDDWSIRDKTNISNAKYIGETVWFKRVMTHSTYGNNVFYIIDPDKLDEDALKVREYKNKINLKGYADVHTPTCDYINLTDAMTDGQNTFVTTGSFDCASIAPLFAPNAFLANGTQINNYLRGYLPASDGGNNYLLTPMRRYNSNKKGFKTSYVKYKVIDGSKKYSAGVTISTDDGKDEVDTSSIDDSKTAYENDRFSVILANSGTSFNKNVSAAIGENGKGEIEIHTENGGEYLNAGDSMQVESGTLLTVRMNGNGYFPESLTLTRSDGSDEPVTLLEADDFDRLSCDINGYYEFHYPMPYSDATFTLNISDTTETLTASAGKNDHGDTYIKIFDKDKNEYVNVPSAQMKKGDEVRVEIYSDSTYKFTGPVFYSSDNNTQLNLNYRSTGYYTDQDGTQYHGYSFFMPATNVRIDAVYDESSYTASLGELEHCTGTMGYLIRAGYGADSVYDTGEPSMNVTSAIDTVCAIITPEKGYAPPLDVITVRNARTKNVINVKKTLFFGMDNEGNTVYYCAFPMPEEDVTVDCSCESCRIIRADTNSFVYDSNNDPACYVDFDNIMGEGTCGSFVSLPTYGNYFSGYIYVDDYHYLSGIKIEGLESGKVYLDDGDLGDIGTNQYDKQLADGVGNLMMSEEEEYISFNAIFMTSPENRIPEDMLVTPTFTRNEKPIPTEPPTQEPTEPPVYYSAMLSSFTGGIPTFELGKNAVMLTKVLPGTRVPFYVTAPKDYEIKSLTVTGKSGADYPYNKAAEPYAEGDDMIFSFDFEMPSEDVVIKGRFEPAPTEAPTQAPTVEPTQVPSEEPTQEPTVPTEPEPSEHGIRTYEELVDFANAVNNGETNANAYLENNILAPAESVWEHGIGSIDGDKPYNGTFDGNGYCIIGLNIDSSDYGALFEHIGDRGTVKDLMIFNTHFKTESGFAAGIAVLNEGVIDHCISGINVLGKTKITLPSGVKINPADYNSVISGTISGGIATVNTGTITGCRNGSVINGAYCGGIAAGNRGVIYGSTNNGAAGTNTAACLAAGGIAVRNNGSIASSYNSGKINCSNAESLGSVAASNNSERVNDVFFNDVNGIPTIGVHSEAALNDTNKFVKNTDMLTQSFVDQLAGVTDDTVTWVRTKYGSTYFNQGYPIVQGRFLQQNTQYLTKEITVTGSMHTSLQTAATAMDTQSEEYQTISAAADGGVLSAYSVSTTDSNGRYVPAELWISGSVQIAVPLENGGIVPTGAESEQYLVLIALNEDDEAVRIYPDSVKDGKAIFNLALPTNFALAYTSEAPLLLGDANLDGEVDITDATIIQRYDARMINLSETALKLADVDKDGEVSIIDATWLQRFCVSMKAPEGIGLPI